MRQLFYHAQVLTQDSKLPEATAFVIEHGKYIAVGNDALLEMEVDERIDLQHAIVLPGFHDAHMHIWKVGNLRTHMLDLRGVRSMEEMKQKLADYIRKHPDQYWIQARGFNEMDFAQPRMPDKSDLDAVVRDRPVVVTRTCAHQVIANSKALELAALDKHTAIPVGGEISYLPNGDLSGHFTETAIGLVLKAIPKYAPHELQEMIMSAQDLCLQYGITSVTDPAVDRDLLQVYKQMNESGALRIRVHAIPIRVPDGKNSIYPNPEKIHTDHLIVNTVKFFADGGLSGKTAALGKPYKNSELRGVLRLDYDTFYPLAKASQEAGLMIATHAIGDAAIDTVLRVYAELNGTHHRIEHLGLPAARHLEIMHKQQIGAVMQPIFIRELGHNFIDALEPERLHQLYPLRSVHEVQVPLALSTDAPVVRDIDPWINIHAAMNRLALNGTCIGPEQTISLETALQAYTLGSAEISGVGDLAGSISVGKQADFQVIRNFEAPLPLAVYVKGKPVA